MSHYNTTREQGDTLHAYQKKAEALEKRILNHMESHPDIPRWSPTALWKVFNDVPITSIRRALCDLTSEGKCFKSELMSVGSYGRREHNWVLRKKI